MYNCLCIEFFCNCSFVIVFSDTLNQCVDFAEVAALLVVVETIAHDKVVGDFHGSILDIEVHLQLLRLEKQCADV